MNKGNQERAAARISRIAGAIALACLSTFATAQSATPSEREVKLQAQVEKLTATLAEQSAIRDRMTDALEAALAAQAEPSSEALALREARIAELELSIFSVRAQMDKRLKTLEEQAAAIESLNAQLAELEQLKTDLGAAMATSEALENELRTMANQLALTEDEAERVGALLAVRDQHIAGLEVSRNALLRKTQEAAGAAEKAAAAMADAEAKLATAEADLAKAREAQGNAESQVETMDAQIATLSGEKARLEQRLMLAEESEAALKAEVASLSSSKADLTEEHVSVIAQRDAAVKNAASLESQLAIRLKALAVARELQAEQRSAASTLSSTTDNLQAELEATRENLAKATVRVNELWPVVQGFQEVAKDHVRQLDAMQALVARSEANSAAQMAEATRLKEQLVRLEGADEKSAALSGEVESLRAELQESEAGNQARDGAIAALEAKLDRLTGVEQSFGEAKAEIAALGEQQTMLEAQLQAAAEENESIDFQRIVLGWLVLPALLLIYSFYRRARRAEEALA